MDESDINIQIEMGIKLGEEGRGEMRRREKGEEFDKREVCKR